MKTIQAKAKMVREMVSNSGYVVCDFDHTLVSTSKLHRGSVRIAALKCGVEVSENTMKKLKGHTEPQIASILRSEYGIDEECFITTRKTALTEAVSAELELNRGSLPWHPLTWGG